MADLGILSDDEAVNMTSTLMDQLTLAKTFAMLILGLGSFVLGVIPMKLTKWWRRKPAVSGSSASSGGHRHGGDTAAGSPVVSLLLCFGGGVLLFTTLLHLQPEVREGVSELQKTGELPSGQGLEHLGDLIFCLGFFMVFLVDEIVHSVLDRYSASHTDKNSAEEVLHRSMSLRRRTMSIPRASLNGGSPNSIPSVTGGISTASNKELLKEASENRYRPAMWDTAGSVGSDDFRPNGHNKQLSLQRFNDDKEKQMKLESGDSDGEDEEHSFRGLFAVLALSFHEVFEGLAIGLEERIGNMWYLFIAVATHKLVIAFCIGLELAWSKTRRPVLVMYVATFAIVTPVGIIIGMLLVQAGSGGSGDGSPGRVAVILQGLAAGTLLYVVFFEVLARHKQSGFSHLLSIILGFSILLALQMITHHHSHGQSAPVDNNQQSSNNDHSSHQLVHDHSSHQLVHDH